MISELGGQRACVAEARVGLVGGALRKSAKHSELSVKRRHLFEKAEKLFESFSET